MSRMCWPKARAWPRAGQVPEANCGALGREAHAAPANRLFQLLRRVFSLIAMVPLACWGCTGDGASSFMDLGGGGAKEDWQILCGRFDGPDRTRTADDLGKALGRVSGLSPARVRVLHEESASVISYGPYQIGRGGDGQVRLSREIKRDLDLIRRLSVGSQYPFLQAVMQRAPSSEVTGPPEWDLRNCPGVLSLQIGIFFDTAGFHEHREAAVEWVKDLRSRGQEAYYFHDEETGRSTVTVGSFDRSAIVRSNEAPSKYATAPRKGPIKDYSPAVIALQQNPEFRYNVVNGGVEKVRGVPQSSFLVLVPKDRGRPVPAQGEAAADPAAARPS